MLHLPVDAATLALYLPVCMAMSFTPGPDTLFVLSRSLANGRAAGIATSVGICTGLYVYAALAGAGLAAIFNYWPFLYEIVKIMGIGYLLWLAWQAFRTNVTPEPAALGSSGSLWHFFFQGVLNDLTNPKAALFFTALFPQFLKPEHGNMLVQALFLNSIGNAFYIAVLTVVAFSAASVSRLLVRSERLRRAQQWIVGSIFLGLAARVAFTQRR